MRRARVLIAAAILGAGCVGDPRDAPCPGPRVDYAIDHLHVRRTAAEPAVGFDLQGSGGPADALGVAMVDLVLELEPGFDVDGPAAAHLAGDTPWILGVAPCGGGRAEVELDQGVDADHDGVVERVRTGVPARGSADGGHVQVTGGTGAAPITILTDGGGGFAPITWTPALGLAADLVMHGDELDGRLGFAIPSPDFDRELVAPIAADFDRLATPTLLDAFDKLPKDGRITLDELLASDLTKAATVGDVRVDGRLGFSAGISIHAVRRATE